MNNFSMGGTSSINVTFSYTHPDQVCEPRGDIFIDFNGQVTRASSKVSTIVLRGGLSRSQFTRSQIEDNVFTMSQGQRVSLMRLMKALSSSTDRASISSDNGMLQEICNAMYNNYCG